MVQSDTLTISKLARLAGVNVETIRFYERQGLIAQPPRGSSGYRYFPYKTVDMIRFIRTARKVGYTIEEVRILIAPYNAGGEQETEEPSVLNTALDLINERMQALASLRDSLCALRGAS